MAQWCNLCNWCRFCRCLWRFLASLCLSGSCVFPLGRSRGWQVVAKILFCKLLCTQICLHKNGPLYINLQKFMHTEVLTPMCMHDAQTDRDGTRQADGIFLACACLSLVYRHTCRPHHRHEDPGRSPSCPPWQQPLSRFSCRRNPCQMRPVGAQAHSDRVVHVSDLSGMRA